MLLRIIKSLALITFLFLISLLFSNPAHAQFSGDLGSISGTVTWGTEYWYGQFTQYVKVDFHGNTTGFNKQIVGVDFNTGFTLPPDTYTVTASTNPQGGPSFVLGSQTVTITEGQTVSNFNFDVSEATGLVKGNIKINGVPSWGIVEICGPLETDPCSFAGNPFYYLNGDGTFSIPLLPGNYRVHMVTGDYLNMGILSIAVVAGQVIDLSTTSVSVPSGQNVTVSLAGIAVTFPEVTTPGFMTVTTTTNPQGGQPPSQYRFLGTYYELTTTATYTGPVTVSFTYNDADVKGKESNLKLFHWDGTTWQNITVSVDTVNNIITGLSPTLSPFAIGESLNTPPTVSAGGPYNVNEGGSTQVTAAGNDPENGPLSYAWDLDNNGSFETAGQTATFSAAGLDGPSSRTIAVQVTDEGSLTASAQATVNVVNVAPIVGAITAPVDPDQVNMSINTSANFTDPSTPDTHTAVWDWGDTTSSIGTVTEINGSGSVAGNHAYTAPGVYTVRLTVVDDDGGSGESVFQFVVVYDPNRGFVTGGGWIDSPIGAYASDPSLTGRANFGFISKYQHGANVPTGQTEFQFKVASFTFHSTSYDWLVVAGPNAKYKGSGTINGNGDYAFMLTAVDGQIGGGGGVDRFRIKIWNKSTNEVIYDNQMGESDDANATDAIEAGSIVIHQ
ncbi:MAG: PKD domain-containing protein [Patescibacteria group bacterium]